MPGPNRNMNSREERDGWAEEVAMKIDAALGEAGMVRDSLRDEGFVGATEDWSKFIAQLEFLHGLAQKLPR